MNWRGRKRVSGNGGCATDVNKILLGLGEEGGKKARETTRMERERERRKISIYWTGM